MEFFQLVRSLSLEAQIAGKKALGADSYQEEPIHFGVHNTLGFPATAVSRIDPPKTKDDPYKLLINFMGLTGPMGVLPDHYTELVIARLHAKDSTLANFFDIFFNHPAATDMYRAWKKNRLYLSVEQEKDKVLETLLKCIIGYGTAGLQNQYSIPDHVFISYPGLFVQRPHCAINLEMMLSDHFKLPIEVQQFQGSYLYLEPRNLGQIRDPNGRGDFADSPHPVAQLGINMMLGNRYWSTDNKIRLRIGPLTQHQFNLLLPGGPQALELAEFTRSFLGPQHEFDAQYILKPEAVPIFKLRSDPGYDLFLMAVDEKPTEQSLKQFQNTHFPLLLQDKTGRIWIYGTTIHSPAQITELDTTEIAAQLTLLTFTDEPQMLPHGKIPPEIRDAIKAQGRHLHFPPRLGRNFFLYSQPPTEPVDGPIFNEQMLRQRDDVTFVIESTYTSHESDPIETHRVPNETDNVLSRFYKEAMTYVQSGINEFSKLSPKIAARFGMSSHGLTDPELQKVFSYWALGRAKLCARLKDGYPEVVNTTLMALYPHYLLPVPAMGIVQIQADLTSLDGALTIPKGEALSMRDAEGNTYASMTCYDTTLLPCTVEAAQFTTQVADVLRKTRPLLPTESVLSLTLKAAGALTFQELAPPCIRFFINAPKEQACLLYKWLLCDTQSITLLVGDTAISLEPEQLRSVGFEKEHALLPYSPLTPLRHQLMTEFFSLPEKFLFFEITELDRALKDVVSDTSEITLVFGFKNSNAALAQQVKTEWFQLGCTPVVNLFNKSLKPFHFVPSQTQYLLNPSENDLNTEIYTVEQIVGKKGADLHHYLPIYGIERRMQAKGKHSGYFRLHHKPTWQGATYLPEGQDTYLDMFDENMSSIEDNKMALHLDTLCLNRRLPDNLSPELSLSKKEEKILSIQQLVPFTRCRWPKSSQYSAWHLLSHLTSAHLSVLKETTPDTQKRDVLQENKTAIALRDMLRLYDLDTSKEHDWIDGILHVAREKSTAIKRTITTDKDTGGRHLHTKVWAGTTITLTVDESRFNKTSLFLFGAAEERFLAGYVPKTTYTELIIVNQNGKTLYAWPPRQGEEKII